MVATHDENEDTVIRLRALGASEIRIGRKRITPSAEVVFALALYLCVRAGERFTRDELTEVFWGEGREVQARHSLRQMLYRLRQKGLTLDEDGEELYLDPARVDSDLRRALEEGWPTTAEPAEVEAAAALTPGLTRHISERFQEWLDGVRHRLAAQHRRGAIRQIAVARREGRWADLDKWALEVLRSDPLNEEATFARAESAAMAGSKAVALEILDAYMEELGEHASKIGLPAKVLRKRIAERRPDRVSGGQRVPIFGRRELIARLTGLLDSTSRGRGSAVILWGAPGIGKTRLAEHTCAYAEIEGFRILSLGASTANSSRPLGLLMSLVSALRDLPGAIGCDPAALAILDRMLARHEASSTTAFSAPPESVRESILPCIAELIAAVTSECRVLVFVDDFHCADEGSRSALLELCERTDDRALMWMITTRNRIVDRERPSGGSHITALYIPPLEVEYAMLMASAVAELSGGRPSPADTARIAQAGGGNPLFLWELSAQKSYANGDLSLPSSLRELMADRLGQLDSSSAKVLRYVALLGSLATIGRLRLLMGGLADLPDILDGLESHGLVRYGATRSLELHECWHQAIDNDIRSVLKASLSMECASLLEAEHPHSVEVAWRAATLYSDAGESSRAVALFVECGQEMLARGFPTEAADMLVRASEFARTPEEQLVVLSVRARAELARGELVAVVDLSTRALSLPRGSTQEGLFAHAVLLALRCEALLKLHRDHRAELQLLATIAQNTSLHRDARQFVCLQGLVLLYADANSHLEEHFLQESRNTSVSHGPSTTGALVELVYAAEHGDAREVHRVERLLSSLEHEDISLYLRCRSLRLRATAMRLIGEWPLSVVLANRAYELAIGSGLADDSTGICEIVIFGCLDHEEYESVALWMERWERFGNASKYVQRSQTIKHARSRLHAQRSEYELGLANSIERGALAATDTLQRRRGVEIATIGLCLAGVGRRAEALERIQTLDAIVSQNRASYQTDYIVEMTLRALILLDLPGEHVRLGESYISKRIREYDAFMAPHFKQLAQFDRQLRSAAGAAAE
ncbi:MAG: ATP-binding protein [Gemmatimonadaceae bacterium]